MEDGITIPASIDSKGFEKGSANLKKAINSMANAAKKLGSKTAKSISGIGKSFQKGFGKIGNMGKSVIRSIVGVGGAVAIISKAVNAFMSQNKELSAKMNGVWTALGNVLGPVITRIINIVASAVSYLLSFLKLLGVTAKSASQLSKSAKGAGGAIKATVAGFDELNKLQDSGGGGGADGTLEDVDPTEWMKKFTDALKNGEFEQVGALIAEQMGEIADKISNFFIDLDNQHYGEKFARIVNGFFGDPEPFRKAGKAIADVANFATHTIDEALNGIDWVQAGTRMSDGLNSFFYNYDWESASRIVSGGINMISGTLYGFFTNFDWTGAAERLSSFLNNAINSIDWIQLGTALVRGVFGILKFVITFVRNIDFRGIFRGLFDLVFSIIKELLWPPTNLLRLLKDIVVGLIDVLGSLVLGQISGLLDSIADMFPDWLGGDKLREAANGITDWWNGCMDSVDEWCESGIEDIEEFCGFTKEETAEAGQSVQDFANSFDSLAGASDAMDSAMQSMTQSGAQFNNVVNNIDTQSAQQKFENLGNAAVTAGKEGTDAFDDFADPLKTASKEAGNTTSSVNETKITTEDLADAIGDVKEEAVNAGQEATEAFHGFNEELVAAYDNSNNLVKAIRDIWANLIGALPKLNEFRTELEGVFNVQWKIPHLIIPHLKVFWESQDWMKTFFGVSAMPNLYVEWYAKGGIVDGATLIGAGEQGKEAIVPLERNTEWINMVAEGLIDRLEKKQYRVDNSAATIDAIADRVAFRMPAFANGSVAPYSVSTSGGSDYADDDKADIVGLLEQFYELLMTLLDKLDNMQFVAQFDDLRALARRITKEQKRQTITEGR